jgi:hypothetical protein
VGFFCLFVCFPLSCFWHTGAWTLGLTLAKQALYHLRHFASRVSLYSRGWSQTQDPPASVSQVLELQELQACTTMAAHSRVPWLACQETLGSIPRTIQEKKILRCNIKFTILTHFYMPSSVASIIFTLFCDHHHRPSAELLPNWNFIPFKH